MKRPSYREAIRWIVINDDTEWLSDPDPIPSVTACLLADLFNIETEKVTADLRRESRKQNAA